MRNARGIIAGVSLGTCLLGLSVFPTQAHAANEYEYGRGLMDMSAPSFRTEDLVEHLIQRLAKSADQNAQLEGMLVEAALRRKQSQRSSAEKRKELLNRADALYQSFLEKGKNHRLAKECEKQRASIKLDHARALVRAAEEEPAKASENRSAAVKIFEQIANVKKAEADKARPVFKKALKEIQAWFDKNPEAERAPSRLLGPAQKALSAYVPKDKMYVIARMEEVSAYPEGQTKVAKAHELCKYCQTQIDSEDLGQLQDVAMWYWFIKGRLHSMILEEKKATEAWKNALDINMESFPPQVKKTVFGIKKLIYRDLVKMKLRVADKDSQKYGDVIEIVRSAKYEPAMKSLFDEPIGKDLLIDYAHALTKQRGATSGDYEQAVQELRRIVEKGPPWSNNASRAMAEVLTRARKNRVKPRLTAQQWFDTARGYFLDGQRSYYRHKELSEGGDAAKADETFKKAVQFYEQSVEYYRRAIGRARNPDFTPVATRLVVEPQAWLEMGLAYLRMRHYYESIIAYQALRSLYKPDARARWLPDKKKDSRFYRNKRIKEALDKLDRVNKANPREDGILSRAQQNIVIALKLNARVKTPFNKRLKIRILEGGGFDEGTTDTDYQAGKLAMDTAKDLMDEGKSFARVKNKKMAAKQYDQALAKLKEAGKRFQKVKKSSKAYEIALYQAASCYTYAQALVAEKKAMSGRSAEELATENKSLGKEALKWYEAYEAHVAKEKEPTEEGIARRKKLGRGALLNRTTVYYSMKDWENVIKACEAFIKHEKANSEEATDDAKFQKMYFNMFRAYSHLAGAQQPPECEANLVKAAEMVNKFASNKKFYKYAIQNLSHRYNNAASRAERAGLDKALITKYEEKIAEYQAIAMKDKEDPSIDDYGRLLYLYEKTGKTRDAADIAEEMLKVFDPENKNSRVEDDKWPILLKRMYKIIKYNDLNKWERCKKDHMSMLDFIYDNEGLRFDHDPARNLPEHDRHPLDYDKALAKINTIEANYKDCPTVKPIEGNAAHFIEGQGYIPYIKGEVEFRRRIIATRDLLSDIAYEVAKQLDKAGQKDEANKYRKMADKQIEILLEVYGNVPAMKLKSANIKFANGDYDGALDMLYKIKHPEPPTSELYIKASKRISEIHFTKGDYRAAAQYPQFIAATAGLKSNWVLKWWPDMEEFLNKCYENGAPRPKKVAKTKVDTRVWEVKTPDQKIFEELDIVYQRGKNDPNLTKTLHTKTFMFKYNFIKGKIEHFREFELLERLLQKYRGKPEEKEVITPAFTERYELIKELVDVERKAWRAFNDYNSAVVDKGGHDNVPSELRQRRDNAFRKQDELLKKLKKMPKIKAPEEK